MSKESQNIPKKSRAVQTLFALACVATLIALFYAEEDWRGWHKWHRFQKECEAKGEHFDLASALPPPVPDDQNFALAPIVASSYEYILTRDGKLIPGNERPKNFADRMHMPVAHEDRPPRNCAGDRVQGTFTKLDVWQSYYREQAAKTNEFRVPMWPRTPAEDVLLALSKYDSQIAELRAACRLPESRFPLNYDSESPWMIYLPHLAQFKSVAVMLQLRSAAELQAGQPDKAADDLLLTLQLTDKIRTEPILITHLVRAAMVQLALQSIWEGLAQHKWSDAQLVALDAELSKLDFVAAYRQGMRGELGGQTGEIDLIRRKPAHVRDLGDLGSDFDKHTVPSAPELAARLAPAGWFYQNEYRCVKLMEDYYLPTANVNDGTFSPAIAERGEAVVAAMQKSPGLFGLYSRLMLPALRNAAVKFAYGQASVNLARTAIALERYRLARGEFPEALDALAPQFIEMVPHDVIGGEALKYRRTNDGQFILYSIGWNQTDDGGKPVFKGGAGSPREESHSALDLEKGDWVWSYPQQ